MVRQPVKLEVNLKPALAAIYDVLDGARNDHHCRRTEIDEIGIVESWVELTTVNPPLVSFRWTFVFHRDKTVAHV